MAFARAGELERARSGGRRLPAAVGELWRSASQLNLYFLASITGEESRGS